MQLWVTSCPARSIARFEVWRYKKEIMTKKLFALLSIVVLPLSLRAGESTNQLHFPAAGFSIAALDAPPGVSPQQPIMMFLSPQEGFAPNVGVQIQPYAGTIDDYADLSVDQFKRAGMKLLERKKLGKSEVVLEYSGMMDGRYLRYYARAAKSGASVYLVTAAALKSEWAKTEARLKACVDSFHLDRH
jgi:hypothetical protein